MLRDRYCCGIAGTVAAGGSKWSVGSALLDTVEGDRSQMGRDFGSGHAVVEPDSSEEVVERVASARSTDASESRTCRSWTAGVFRYSDEVDLEEWPFELS